MSGQDRQLVFRYTKINAVIFCKIDKAEWLIPSGWSTSYTAQQPCYHDAIRLSVRHLQVSIYTITNALCLNCSFPSENLSAQLLNQGLRTIFFGLSMGVSPLCAVDQVIHILETEKVQTVVKIDRQSEFITDALKKSPSLNGRVWLLFMVRS